MSKKLWILVLGVLALLSAAALAALTMFIAVPMYRSQDHLERATAAVAAGNDGEAKRFYREYLYLNQDDGEILEAYAELCMAQLDNRRQNLTEAGRAYLKIFQLDPQNVERRQALLSFYNRYQFWDELDAAVDIMLRTASPDAELAYQKAVAIQGQGRTSDAMAAFEQYLENTDYPRRDVPLRLARIYRELERNSQAVELLERERANYPEDPDVAAAYANYLMDNEDSDGAAVLLPPASEAADAGGDTVRALARLKSQQDDFEAVLEITSEALTDDPDNIDLHLTHLLALERLGQREAALEHIEGLDPALRIDAPGILLFQVEVLLAGGDTEAADKVRVAYGDAYPGQAPTDEYIKGRIAFEESEYPEARNHFTLAVEMNPNLQRARYYQALAMLQMGDRPAARASLEIYLRNNPDDRQARQLYSRNFERDKSILELRVAGQRLLDEASPAMDDLFFTAQDLLASRNAEDEALARRLVEKSIELYADDPRGYTALAGYHLEVGGVEEAADVLARAENAGIDRASFALLDASIALMRSDEGTALQIARRALETAETETLMQWATFFSRRGFAAAGQRLLTSFSAEMSGEELSDLTLFGVELALQFDTTEAALVKLREAEKTLGNAPDTLNALNAVRISVAQRLLASGDAALEATAGEIQAAVAATEPEHDGLQLMAARKAMRESPPNLAAVQNSVDTIGEDSAYRNDADLIRAEVSLLQGRYDRTERLALEVADRTPNNKSAWHLAGDAQLRSGKTEAARASLERVLEIDRSDGRAMQSLVRIYSRMQLRRQAEAMYERYAALTASRPEAENNLADLRAILDMQAGDLAAAEANYREQLATRPGDYAALNGLARALSMRDRPDEALALVRAFTTEQNPSTPEPWTFLGQLLLDRRDGALLGEASSAFTQAQVLLPGYTPALLGNIEVQSRLGNDGVAIALCDRYLAERESSGTAFTEQDAQVLFQRAALRAKSRSGEESALADLDRAIATVELPRFLSFRASLRATQDDAQGAISDLRRVTELSGVLSVADQLILAEAYLSTGDLENAQRAAEAANGRRVEAGPALAARIDNVMAQINDGKSQ